MRIATVFIAVSLFMQPSWASVTIRAQTPYLVSIEPSWGEQGATLSVNLDGESTHFVNGVTTADFGEKITVNNVAVTSPTTATANITIAKDAPPTTRDVIVTTGLEILRLSAGLSCGGFVVIEPPPPTPVLTSVTPNSGQQGALLSVSLTGLFTHFAEGTTASFGGGITVNNLTVAGATNVTADITIAAGAALGSRDVTLTTGSEVATASNGFIVTAGTPVVTSVSPVSGQQGSSLSVSLAGQFTHFANGTEVRFGAGIIVTRVRVGNTGSVAADISISGDAPLGPRDVTLTTGTEVATAVNAFAVTAGTPVLTGISPNSGKQGTTLLVTITGQFTHFVDGTTSVGFGPGITLNALTVLSPTSLAANIRIGDDATTGERRLTVATGAEVLVSSFILESRDSAAPTVSIINPVNGAPETGFTTVSASASDDVGVMGVQFFVNGSPLGAELATTPYEIVWDTTNVADGIYLLAASARDAVGNVTTASVNVTVSNLAASYSVPTNGARSLRLSRAPVATVSTSHARILPAPGTSTPAGVAIIGLHASDLRTSQTETIGPTAAASDLLLSEATVPASVEMRSGIVYVDNLKSANTGIALSNQTSESALISFNFTDAAGNSFGGGYFTLASNHQIAAFLNEPPFKGPKGFRGTFTFASDAPVGAIALLSETNERGEFLFTTIPVSPLSLWDNAASLLPLFVDGGGWTTEVILTNPSLSTQNGTVEFYGPGDGGQPASLLVFTVNGTSGSTFKYSIPSHSMLRLVTGGPASGAVRTGSVRISPDVGNPFNGGTPIALSVLSFRNSEGTVVTKSGVAGRAAGYAFRTYVESSAVGPVHTGVAITNTSSSFNTVNLELTSLDGAPSGAHQSIALPGGGQICKFIDEIFTNLPPDFRGILKLTSTAPVTIATLRGRYTSRGDFLITDIPPINESESLPDAVVFPHVVTGGGFATEVILLSQPGQAAFGKLPSISQDGSFQ